MRGVKGNALFACFRLAPNSAFREDKEMYRNIKQVHSAMANTNTLGTLKFLCHAEFSLINL